MKKKQKKIIFSSSVLFVVIQIVIVSFFLNYKYDLCLTFFTFLNAYAATMFYMTFEMAVCKISRRKIAINYLYVFVIFVLSYTISDFIARQIPENLYTSKYVICMALISAGVTIMITNYIIRKELKNKRKKPDKE